MVRQFVIIVVALISCTAVRAADASSAEALQKSGERFFKAYVAGDEKAVWSLISRFDKKLMGDLPEAQALKGLARQLGAAADLASHKISAVKTPQTDLRLDSRFGLVLVSPKEGEGRTREWPFIREKGSWRYCLGYSGVMSRWMMLNVEMKQLGLSLMRVNHGSGPLPDSLSGLDVPRALCGKTQGTPSFPRLLFRPGAPREEGRVIAATGAPIRFYLPRFVPKPLVKLLDNEARIVLMGDCTTQIKAADDLPKDLVPVK